MDNNLLKPYRQQALQRLEQLLLALDETPNEADYFVDSSIRKLSNIANRPENAPPYKGLYGEKPSLDAYRDIACDRLQTLLIALPTLNPIDGDIDKYIRILANLPPRPADVEPYVRLFTLRSEDPDPLVIPPTPPATTGKQLVTSDQLIKIAGTSQYKDRLIAFTPGVNQTLEKYQINTKLRIAHFLAQVFHESGGFRWLREIWGPTKIQENYEGRKDLGNNQAGDGKKYMGRGLIQLTGKANYQQFSTAVGVDFISKPELLEQPPYAVLVAGWFWDTRKLNAFADQDDIKTITRKINGGYYGLEDRQKYLDRAKSAL